MTSRNWAWIGACATGSSHLKSETPCQDAGACIEVPFGERTALIAAVSDGAGSARHSAAGSRTVVRGFLSNAARFVKKENSTETISVETVRSWLDDIRDRIAVLAAAIGAIRRDYAATLVATIICPDRLIACHIGDGACVTRAEADDGWHVPTWPAHGEYASSTYFVTDDPEPALRFQVLEGRYTHCALFSDGLERLALDFASSTAFPKFIDPMFAPLSKLPAGRNRALSFQLRDFLNGKSVSDRTDDDRTLLLATRTQEP